MIYTFTIYGKPFGKQRPKFSRRGNFVQTYTPEATVSYENLVKLSFKEQLMDTMVEGFFPLSGALDVSINAYFPIPKSTSKKNKLRMLLEKIFPTKKPDCDNIAKAVLDSLNNIAYKDDVQVVDLHVKKRYAEQPRTEVTIKELETWQI